MAGGSSDFIYGSIFTVYMACFIFIAAYLMVRRRRGEIESNEATKIQQLIQEQEDTKKNS